MNPGALVTTAVKQAQSIIPQVRELLPSNNLNADPVAVAILTAGILISAKLQLISESGPSTK